MKSTIFNIFNFLSIFDLSIILSTERKAWPIWYRYSVVTIFVNVIVLLAIKLN